jgi:hypothetical protein
MPLSKSQFKHRPQWQREVLREKYENSQRTGQQKRTNAFSASRERLQSLGFTIRAWEQLPNPESALPSGHGEPLPSLPPAIAGDCLPAANDSGADGIHPLPLQECELPDVWCNSQSSGIPDEGE